MLSHVSCAMPKQKIIETIVSEFDRSRKLLDEHPSERNEGRYLAYMELLRLIPIYENE